MHNFLWMSPFLAFENCSQDDEYFFDGIYANPDLPTMNLIKNANTLEDVLNGLPEKPPNNPDIFTK